MLFNLYGEYLMKEALTEVGDSKIGRRIINKVRFAERKANWIGHILRRNCLLHDAIEGQMTEVKSVGRR